MEKLDKAMNYVRAHRPRVVVLENVSRLLHPSMRWVLDRITAILRSLEGYAWRRGFVCCSQLGASMRRPRIFWVGVRT